MDGDGEVIIESARPLRDAGAGAITFVDHERHSAELDSSGAAAAVVSIDTPRIEMPLIRVADPRSAFTKIAQHLHARPPLPVHGIDPLASVNATARIGPACQACLHWSASPSA